MSVRHKYTMLIVYSKMTIIKKMLKGNKNVST